MCLEDSCKEYLHSLTHDLYRCLAFWVAFGSSFDIGCSSKSKNKKKACINSQCFDFYLKRDVHVRLQRFTEKK